MKPLVWILFATFPTFASANCEALKFGQIEQFAQVARPECKVSKSLSGVQHYCFWQFEFRAIEAQEFAKQLATSVQSCGAVAVSASNPVNHPDTFDQVLFDLAGHGISISIKDKTTLSKTLVFLSVTF